MDLGSRQTALYKNQINYYKNKILFVRVIQQWEKCLNYSVSVFFDNFSASFAFNLNTNSNE